MYGPEMFLRGKKEKVQEGVEKIDDNRGMLLWTGSELCEGINRLTSDVEDIIRSCLGKESLARAMQYKKTCQFPDLKPQVPYSLFHRDVIHALRQEAEHHELQIIGHAARLAEKYLSDMESCMDNMDVICRKMREYHEDLCDLSMIDIPFPQPLRSSAMLYLLDNNGLFLKTKVYCEPKKKPKDMGITGLTKDDMFTEFPFEYNERILDLLRMEARRKRTNVYVVFNFSTNIYDDMMEAKAVRRTREHYEESVAAGIPHSNGEEKWMNTALANGFYALLCRGMQMQIAGIPVNENETELE
jgi:hypothetical protein